MNELQIFKNEEFGEVRTVAVNNDIWFCLKDICDALGIKNATMTAQRLEEDEVTKLDLGRQGKANFINESGLYSVILRSDKEYAKRFRKWVTSEVLPSIRKTGGYIDNQENLSESELVAKALLVVNRQLEERNKEIEIMKPKALFADAVSASKSSILVGDLAKLICQNGYQIGQQRLFEWLRNNGYLIKGGTSKNMPTQRYLEQGLFEIKETTVTHSDGHIHINKTVKVTGKGQVYFVNKFLEKKEVATE